MDEAELPEELRLLDAAARCSICHSPFDAPLALRACGHSCEPPPPPPAAAGR
jgi:hypothetical protein